MIWRLLLGLIAASAAIGLRGTLAEANAARRGGAFRYTPHPKLARLGSLGHRSSMANLIWLRAIPDLSASFVDAEHKQRWLNGVLNVVTDLEPHFETVFDYGAAYMDLIAADHDFARKLLQDGVDKNPDNVRLRLKLALHYLERDQDRVSALEHLRWVLDDPRCDAMTAALASALMVDEGQDLAAFAYWTQFLDHGNEQVREVSELHYERIKRKIVLRTWNAFVEREGREPNTVQEMNDGVLLTREVAELVLSSMHLQDGKRSFPRLDELERAHRLRGLAHWCGIFREEAGRWPTLEELLNNPALKVPAAPRGLRYVLTEGKPSLVPITPAESTME